MLVPALMTLAVLAPQDIKTLTSRTGEFRLDVLEDEAGTFTWSVRRRGEFQWRKALLHSAAEALLCSDGTVVAIGSDHPRVSPADQAWALTILAPNGSARLLELHPKRELHSAGVGAIPRPHGLLLWEAVDTCAFWITEERSQVLRTYSISRGTFSGQLEPEQVLEDAMGLGRGELTLWSTQAPGDNELLLTTFASGPFREKRGVLALMDTRGKLLWHAVLTSGRTYLPPLVHASSAAELRFFVAVVEDAKQMRCFSPFYTTVDTLALHFHRDAAGVWRPE